MIFFFSGSSGGGGYDRGERRGYGGGGGGGGGDSYSRRQGNHFQPLKLNSTLYWNNVLVLAKIHSFLEQKF